MLDANSPCCLDAEILNTNVVRLQFAFNGKWETALHLAQQADSVRKTQDWLAGGTQDLAIEAFFPVQHGQAFVGVRLAAIPVQDQHEVAMQLAGFFAQATSLSVGGFIRWVESRLACSLFKAPPAFLELGKVNAWRTFGSVVFWPDDAGRPPLEAYQHAVEGNPRFREPSELPYAVERGFGGAFAHWIGLPISALKNGMHCIEDGAVRDVLLSTMPLLG